MHTDDIHTVHPIHQQTEKIKSKSAIVTTSTNVSNTPETQLIVHNLYYSSKSYHIQNSTHTATSGASAALN